MNSKLVTGGNRSLLIEVGLFAFWGGGARQPSGPGPPHSRGF